MNDKNNENDKLVYIGSSKIANGGQGTKRIYVPKVAATRIKSKSIYNWFLVIGETKTLPGDIILRKEQTHPQ